MNKPFVFRKEEHPGCYRDRPTCEFCDYRGTNRQQATFNEAMLKYCRDRKVPYPHGDMLLDITDVWVTIDPSDEIDGRSPVIYVRAIGDIIENNYKKGEITHHD